MKLTELQIHLIDGALRDLQCVLTQTKQKTLKGKNLAEMKLLESTVTSLEIFRMGVYLL